jgi:chaperonin cofactor prefoldin
MPNRDDTDAGPNVFDTLLMPLRLPGRVVSDIGVLAEAVVALQSDAKQHLSSVDDRAGLLVAALSTLQGSINHIDGKVDKLEAERMDAFLDAVGTLQTSIDRIELNVEKLESLEETLTVRIDGLRADLNNRMIAVEQTVAAMSMPMEEMADDVAKIDELLPNPKDGPLTRLKDTLTSSGG